MENGSELPKKVKENKTHLITALVAYLDSPIKASLMGLRALCEGERHHEKR